MYSWSKNPCVRFHDNILDEEHPCYWCGTPIPISSLTKFCKNCGGAVCQNCGKCWCNVSREESDSLHILRDKYCCNWHHFGKGFEESDNNLLSTVSGFRSALNYCRGKKGV